MNWYSVFYWLTVADGVKSVFDTASNWFTFFSVISLIFYAIMIATSADPSILSLNSDDETKKSVLSWRKFASRFFWISVILCTITWVGYVATPTKKDAVMILAGGATMELVTNDSTAKQIPHEVFDYVLTEIKSAAADAKVDLNISNQKDKVLESVKDLSAEQLIEKMRSDSTLAKIVLEK